MFGFKSRKSREEQARLKVQAEEQERARIELMGAVLDVARIYRGSDEAFERQTVPDDRVSEMPIGNTRYKVIQPLVPKTVQDAVDALSMFNPDVSQMINNVVQLGNTGHFVEVVGGGKRAIKTAMERLKERAASIYDVSAGVDGLVNDLLAQQARRGALSAEIILSKRLSDGVENVALVPYHSIRWMREIATGRVVPAQYLGDIKDRVLWNIKRGDYILLNPDTFVCYRQDSLEDSPYAIPPVLAALTNLNIQREMVRNLAAVTRKVGLVGFLSVLLSAPEMLPGEKREAYRSRMKTYIDEQADSIKDSYKDGLFVGFKKQHETSHMSLASDLRGLQDVVQINEEQIFSGLKSDPAMHGRTYSTTETYAGVVFDKLLAQLGCYKRLVKRFLEKMYSLDLASTGVIVDRVRVTFKPAKPLNELLEQQARAAKFTNALNELKIEAISWDDFCRQIGIDSPFKDKPNLEALMPPKPEPAGAPDKKEPDKASDAKNKEKKKAKNVLDNEALESDTRFVGRLDIRTGEVIYNA